MSRRNFLQAAGGATAQFESFSFTLPGLVCWQKLPRDLRPFGRLRASCVFLRCFGVNFWSL
jgi:hypothetical protein